METVKKKESATGIAEKKQRVSKTRSLSSKRYDRKKLMVKPRGLLGALKGKIILHGTPEEVFDLD